MKAILLIIITITLSTVTFAQTKTDKELINIACMNYLDGFYKGETEKLIYSLQPSLHKFGFWKNKETGIYSSEGLMSYNEALDYSKRVFKDKHFPNENAPKKK